MAVLFTPSQDRCFPQNQISNCNATSGCLSADLSNVDSFGCPRDRCPDFLIKRHDTKPAFKVSVEDCDGPLDLTGLVLEVNMWSIARLKADIAGSNTYFALANNIGFNQVMVGDIIIMDRVRRPEHMLVTAFDENNKLIQVQRGYNGTPISEWKKGSLMRIFRVLNGVGEVEMLFDDIEQVDGTTLTNQLTDSFFIYEWNAEDTCLPGCYWLEFKLIKMLGPAHFLFSTAWTGPRHLVGSTYYTGTIQTDSSVILTFNPADNTYLIQDGEWRGATHLSSGQYFTGSVFDDGSVPLSITNIQALCNGCTTPSAVSFVPSFTNPSLTPADFGCTLGDGVEWVRRFPSDGEGFLIKIACSSTTEF